MSAAQLIILLVQIIAIVLLSVILAQLRSIVKTIKSHSDLMITLSTGIARTLASGGRIEAGAAKDRELVVGVAEDLLESHKQADAVGGGLPHGAAADAAARTPNGGNK